MTACSPSTWPQGRSHLFGLVAMLSERAPDHRSRSGAAFRTAVLAVALTAAGLVAFDLEALWWLLPLAALSYALALAGHRAPGHRGRAWIRVYAHGQGGAYIALVTALRREELVTPRSPWTAMTCSGSGHSAAATRTRSRRSSIAIAAR